MSWWRSLLGLPNATPPDAGVEDRDGSLGFQDWVDMFTFGGNSYPLLNTTWANTPDEELARSNYQAYKANGPVFALVLARLQVFSQARFQWTRFSEGQPSKLFGTPELKILERPWPGGVSADLLGRMEVHVSRAGNSYVRRIRRGSGLTRVDRLHCMRPEWVTIVLGSDEDAEHPSEAADVELVGYLYKPGGRPERMITLFPEEVAHYAPIPDPDNNFLGMSWITPVLMETASDDAATIHKRKFFQNAATPNLAIKFDPTVGIEDVRKFKALVEEEHKGLWNAYKTLYLGGGADATPIGANFRELEFAATQGKGESRLASAAGVPPSWVGFSEGLQGSALNAGNFGAAARRRFGDGTMQHLWTNACASLETIVPPEANSRTAGANLWFSSKGIPFLREDATDLATIQTQEAATITQLVREGFTAESAVAAVQAQDWALLVHTGLVSVQLQAPGAQSSEPTTTAPAAEPAGASKEGE